MAAPGDLIAGRYRLGRVLGRGGMGVVWEGIDERLHRPVALKQLRTQHGLGEAETELANQRAMREARITARLHHPNAVSVFDVVEHEDQPCLVMQLVPSVPLTQVLRDLGALQPLEAARVGAQVATALAEAHRVGIVHRDVKPGNILIGDDGVARISDFGISRALGDSTLTATGMLPGTPAYLAPEVARGADSSAASDVYSLGATLYAAVEGGPPFGTDPNLMALLHKVAVGDYQLPRRAGPLTELLQQLLARDPRDRPPMSEVAQALNGVVARGQSAAGLAEDPATTASAQSPTLLLRPYPGTPAETDTPPRETAPRETTPRSTPAPAAVPAPPSAPTPAAPSTAPRRRGLALAVVALLLIAGIVLAAVLLPRSDQTTTAGDPSGSESSSAAAEPSADEPSPDESGTAAPPPAETSAPAPTPPEPTPTPEEDDDAPTAAELAGAITDYYALMPDGTDRAWSRMTRSYQANTARGRESYEEFWDEIEKVSVSNVTGSPPNRAEATVTYVYKDEDRGTVRERTAYELVTEGDQLKINGSRVLGSG